ncbi:hypothetical protein BH09ACT1_BH09ACT1_22570 [soil metagenome]
MGIDGFGSSIIIAMAALLWLVYLVPTWLRRREYLATERNALRLQQTLRILAESAEVPEEVRAEANARSVVEQEKLLKKENQRSTAAARAAAVASSRAAARTLAASRPIIAADVASGSTASRRLRRSRAITSLVMLGSVIAAGVGFGQYAASGSWLVLATGSVVAIGSFAMLGQMAAVGKARAQLARTVQVQAPVVASAPRQRVVIPQAAPVVQTGWTPVPIPKPLYMSRPLPDRALINSLDAAAELRQAAADSERKLREALDSPEVTPIRRAAPAPAAPSRFASMGFVEQAEGGKTDLDEVLRRRRTAAAS